MSTIGSHPGIPQTGLDLLLGQQQALELYGRQTGPAPETAPATGDAPAVSTGDPGQATLNTRVSADGNRPLSDPRLTADLAGQPRADAVQHGVAEILAALAR